MTTADQPTDAGASSAGTIHEYRLGGGDLAVAGLLADGVEIPNGKILTVALHQGRPAIWVQHPSRTGDGRTLRIRGVRNGQAPPPEAVYLGTITGLSDLIAFGGVLHLFRDFTPADLVRAAFGGAW